MVACIDVDVAGRTARRQPTPRITRRLGRHDAPALRRLPWMLGAGALIATAQHPGMRQVGVALDRELPGFRGPAHLRRTAAGGRQRAAATLQPNPQPAAGSLLLSAFCNHPRGQAASVQGDCIWEEHGLLPGLCLSQLWTRRLSEAQRSGLDCFRCSRRSPATPLGQASLPTLTLLLLLLLTFGIHTGQLEPCFHLSILTHPRSSFWPSFPLPPWQQARRGHLQPCAIVLPAAAAAGASPLQPTCSPSRVRRAVPQACRNRRTATACGVE